jgi:hypothetical protein
MKIDSLFENVTPSSTPDGNNPASAPKFGRNPKVLEDDKIEETTAGATGSGSVASVSQPIGSIQKRGTGALFKGINTSSKYPNSKAVKEEEIREQDIIINPVLRKGPKPGFHNRNDHEGDTVKNSLYTIVQAAKDLNDAIENTTQFPEWVSEKIGAIKHMMVVVKDYVKSQQKRGDDNVIDEGDAQYVKKDPSSFLDDDFYAFDPKTKVIKDTWGHKSVGRGYSENRAKQEGWAVAPGLRAKHLGLLQMQRGTNEGGFDIPEIPRTPTPKPVPKNSMPEGLPQTLRKIVPGYGRRKEVDEGGLNEFAPNDGDDNFDRKIYYVVQEPDEHYSTYALNPNTIDTDEFKVRFSKKLWVEGPFMDLDDAHEAIWAHIEKNKGVAEGSAQDKLHKRHQELRKKSGLPDVNYYKELLATYDLPDQERLAKQQEIKQKYKVK